MGPMTIYSASLPYDAADDVTGATAVVIGDVGFIRCDQVEWWLISKLFEKYFWNRFLSKTSDTYGNPYKYSYCNKEIRGFDNNQLKFNFKVTKVKRTWNCLNKNIVFL